MFNNKKLVHSVFMIFQIFRLFTLLSLALLLLACGSESTEKTVDQTPYKYLKPSQNNDGWQTADLNELGIDPAPFETMVENIRADIHGYRFIDSVLVAKNNKLVFYELTRDELDFADGWANNKDINLHVLNSVTKSFNSALIGIAIDKGFIQDVNVSVHDYFPDKQPIANWDERKAAITLKDWLTMQSGYLWDEWDVSYLDANNLNSQMNNAADPIQFLLDRPMANNPGEVFAYSTGISFGLGRILQIATGQSVTHFMEQNLFTPMNINTYDYWSLDGQLHTGSALYLGTRDMAKFGQLFLNKGQWNGQQLISEAWVEESTRQFVDKNTWGYAYQWWLRRLSVNGRTLETFYADGYGGQLIFVFPEINAVVCFTGDAYNEGDNEQRNILSILEHDILPGLL